MRDPRHRLHPANPSNPPIGIPAAQARALDRRHRLDEQQRAVRDSGVLLQTTTRPRPPA